MIAPFTAKTGRNFCTRVAGRRFRRLSAMQCVAVHPIDELHDGSKATIRSLHSSGDHKCTTFNVNVFNSFGVNKPATRNYSSSFIAPTEKSGQEHHAFFQEQMMELEKEQKQFGANQDGNIGDFPNAPTASFDLEDQLSDWKSEQTQVFGETLADHDGSIPNKPDPGLDPEEREARFHFTDEDMVAWGRPNPSAGDMQKILEQVALEREKEDAYAKSASLSPKESTDNSSETDHHESFSHVSGDGSSVHMVDVGHKAVTARTAHARSEVWLPPDVLEAFLQKNEHSDELVGPKGPIFATAKIAGIMACKKTSDLIPLCHPLPLDQVKLDIRMKEDEDDNDTGGTVVIDCTCKVTHKTGVEMEALTGATVAALTIYDMTKAVSHNIRIRETRLMGKTGGKRTVLDGAEKQRLP